LVSADVRTSAWSRVRRAADYCGPFRRYGRIVGRLHLPQVDQRMLDRAVAAGLLVMGWVEAAMAPAGSSRWLQACLTVGYTVPLLWRRRWPVPVLAIIAVLGPTMSVANREGGVISFVLAMILAAFTVGRQLEPPATWWGPALTVGYPWVLAAATRSGIDGYVFPVVIYGGAWAAGYAIQQREVKVDQLARQTDTLVQQQHERERHAVAQERSRIARELHDIVSHSISVITIQTQAVRKRLGPEHAAEIDDLRGIEGTARQAMAEMRRLLGVLRSEDDPPALAPQPGLDQLPRLIAETRSAGVQVELRITGDPVPLSPGVDLAAYRVLQEALTNVRKHADGGHATVDVRYGDNGLALLVANQTAHADASPESAGHGLIGMRERIALYGGTLQVTHQPSGSFSLHATLPTRPR
jgi:signal transduction histidine kinase